MQDSHFVLVVEPNMGDALALESAFKEHKVCHPARIIRNDYELRSYLKGAGAYSNRELFPLPDLLLLDFSDPVMAVNLLEWLGFAGYLNFFPVIGLGKFKATKALQVAFDLGLNGFFEKPDDLRGLARMICELEWVDGWKVKLGDADHPQLLSKEQFYRLGSA